MVQPWAAAGFECFCVDTDTRKAYGPICANGMARRRTVAVAIILGLAWAHLAAAEKNYGPGVSAPKTVEQTRKLVEQDVFPLSSAPSAHRPTPRSTNISNERHVPQLFIASGASKWRDYKNSPWTLSATMNYVTEGEIYAK